MQPHYSQSSRENATSSSGTSPLATYKEVPPGLNWPLESTLDGLSRYGLLCLHRKLIMHIIL